jgi:tetratricopeptide (TPR) repeat protein
VNLGFVALQYDRYDEAIDWLQSADRAAMDLGAEFLEQMASGNLGWAYFQLGDDERALALFLDAQKSAARLGDTRDELRWIATAGYVYHDLGDSVRAEQSYRQTLDLARKIESKEEIASALGDLAQISVETGKLDEAGAFLDQLTPLESAGGTRLHASVMLTRGMLATARRQDQQAETLFRAIQSKPEFPTLMRLDAGNELAWLFERQGNTRDAERIYKATLAAFESAREQLKNENSQLPFSANATSIYDDYIHLLVEQ